MHAVKTRIAGALALLALGLLGAPAGPAAGDDGARTIFTALPPAPQEAVTDNAQFLAPEARARLAGKIKQFRDVHSFVRVYVYTLRSANGARPADAMQELYRRWRMRNREIYDGLATVFVFWDEKKALVMLGQGAPPSTEAALADLSPELAAVFGPDPEGALTRIVDRIGESLSRADSTSWLDSPPVPDAPDGPVHGNADFADEADTRALEAAASRASTPDHPIVLVLNPAKGLDSPSQRADKLEKAWPGRILLVAFRPDSAVSLAIPDALKDRFPEDQRQRILHEVRAAMTNASYARTLARAASELAMLAEGKTPPPWVAWKHPLKTIGGGQDEDPAPLALGVGIGVVALLLILWFVYTLVTNPLAIVAFVAEGVIEGLIGGLFGGGGSGGGGFSGGGGSFGGGGASGSW